MLNIESIDRESDSSVAIRCRDETKGGMCDVSVYIENNQIMVRAENSECVVTIAPFED